MITIKKTREKFLAGVWRLGAWISNSTSRNKHNALFTFVQCLATKRQDPNAHCRKTVDPVGIINTALVTQGIYSETGIQYGIKLYFVCLWHSPNCRSQVILHFTLYSQL
jgi:hypothetical protein